MTTNGSGSSGAGNDVRRERLLEVTVFLFLITPSFIISSFIVREGNASFVLIALSTILRDLAFVSLIVFFVWRNGEHLELVGWSLRNVGRETVIGIWLFIPLFFGAGALDAGLRSVGFSAPAVPLPSLVAEKTVPEFVLAAVMVGVVALAEETIFRGYLILRLREITSSTAAAVLLSAVLFSLGHGYEGSAGVVTVGVMGLVFALVYLWRRSLVAPMVMHFLQDFIGIVLVPLLGMRS